LDLFSGSGALGLECVSRGASWVLSIEKVPRHVAAIRDNLAATNLPESYHDTRTQDVFVALRQLASEGQLFDLITADPPFGPKNVGVRSRSASQKLLDDDGLPRLLEKDGLLVLGHTCRDTLAIPPTWSERKVLKHGDSVVRILQRAMVDSRSVAAAEE
jgi:16S rRNA (guanine966-N2)-methyltransferase